MHWQPSGELLPPRPAAASGLLPGDDDLLAGDPHLLAPPQARPRHGVRKQRQRRHCGVIKSSVKVSTKFRGNFDNIHSENTTSAFTIQNMFIINHLGVIQF